MAVQFVSGSSDYYRSSTSIQIPGSTFEMRAMVKPTSTSASGTIMGYYNSATNNDFYQIAIDTKTTDNWFMSAIDGGASHAQSVSPYWSAGTWYSITGGQTTGGPFLNFIRQDDASYGSLNHSKSPDGLDRMGIGGRAGSSEQGFAAVSMAELAVWDRTLDADERAALTLGYSPLFFKNSLIFYAPLNNVFGELPRDLISGETFTAPNGTPDIVAHPKVIYPRSSQVTVPSAGVAATALPMAMNHYRRRRV
jgi:hypothetical protein